MQKLAVELFADYFQFYIQDDNIEYGDLSDAWTPEATEKLLAETEFVLGIGTVRNMDVPVFIEFAEVLPALNPADWDKLNYSTLNCETGRLVVAGCTDYYPDAQRIHVTPGLYDVAVAYKNLTKISEDRLNGEDSYHLFLALKSVHNLKEES